MKFLKRDISKSAEAWAFLGLLALAMLLSPAASWFKKLSSPKLNIDFSYVADSDSHDGVSPSDSYFYWKNASGKVRDSFDAVTGASKKGATKRFDAVRLDKSGKKMLLPRGLRALFLFAVSEPSLASKDFLSIGREDGILVISFVHRANAFRIVCDAKDCLVFNGPEKKIEVPAQDSPEMNAEADSNSETVSVPDTAEPVSVPEKTETAQFYIAKDIAVQGEDGKFSLKEEFMAEQGQPDWKAMNFEADEVDYTAGLYYIGKLAVKSFDNRLTVKGTLQQISE